jgi:hypothetical protein
MQPAADANRLLRERLIAMVGDVAMIGDGLPD